jgi:hypothetical protein
MWWGAGSIDGNGYRFRPMGDRRTSGMEGNGAEMPAANPTRRCAAGEGRGYMTLIKVQELDDAPRAADDGATRSRPTMWMTTLSVHSTRRYQLGCTRIRVVPSTTLARTTSGGLS